VNDKYKTQKNKRFTPQYMAGDKIILGRGKKNRIRAETPRQGGEQLLKMETNL